MTANINTILVLGATSGLGDKFARYFHSKGKTVIAAGRNVSRLANLQAELPGITTLELDVTDFSTLESKLQTLLTQFPHLDSVFALSGIMSLSNLTDPSTTSAEAIVKEVSTNLIAPMIIARILIPHLMSLDKPTTFITMNSGLAFIPLPFYPFYNATKAGLHNFSLNLRMQTADTQVKVIEVVAPYVDTALDSKFRADFLKAHGNKGAAPVPVDEYIATTVADFEREEVPNEIASGFAALGLGAWRGAFDPIFEQFGMKG